MRCLSLALFILLVSQPVLTQDCTRLLSVLYQFAGNINDSSDNNLDATLQGNIQLSDYLTVPGDNQSALIVPSAAIDGATDFTFSFRVRFHFFHTETTGAGNPPINSMISGFSQNNALGFGYVRNQNWFNFTFAGTANEIPLEQPLVENRWYCIVVSRRTNVLRIHLDGSQVGDDLSISTDPVEVLENGLVLGQDQDCLTGCYETNQSMAGDLDNFRIYRLALETQEIAFACQTTFIDTTVCAGVSYAGYSTTGLYEDNLISTRGCDSIRLLNLMVLDTPTSIFSDTICAGESYLGYGTTGSYQDTFVSQFGCDSIRSLDLLVGEVEATIIDTTICEGQDVAGYSRSGIYEDDYQSKLGCDSSRLLQLSVVFFFERSERKQLCPGDSYRGYTETGRYIDVVSNPNGCDTVISLNLSVASVYAPNAFSPNFDGVNDVFRLFSSSTEMELRELQVFNRWGGLVHDKNYPIGATVGDANWWNGRQNGKELNTGTYLYRTEWVCGDRVYIHTGDVLLLH